MAGRRQELSIKTAHQPSSRFDSYFPEEAVDANSASRDSFSNDADLASLPFPAPLATLRRDFRSLEFSPDAFLVQHQRHGQLDDLLTELRALAKQLDAELTAGVQRDYASFIQLGKTDPTRLEGLKAGAEEVRAEAVKMAQEAAAEADEAEALLTERATIRAQKEEARRQLRCMRSVDALADLLAPFDADNHDETDATQDATDATRLQMLKEASHLCGKLNRWRATTMLPDATSDLLAQLQLTLQVRLQRAIHAAPAETRLDLAHLLRQCTPAAVHD